MPEGNVTQAMRGEDMLRGGGGGGGTGSRRSVDISSMPRLLSLWHIFILVQVEPTWDLWLMP